MDLSRYQALIFDLDGTLVDSMPLHLAAWCHAAEKFGFTYDADWFYSLGGVPGRKIARMLTEKQQLDLDPDAIAQTKTGHYVRHIEQATPINDTLAVVEQAFGRLPMAIGTGSPRVNAHRVLDNTGLTHYFDAVITAEDVEHHKPNPDTFLLAAKRLGVAPEKCLVFEDTGIGKQAALAAGMDCCLVENGHLTEPCHAVVA